MPVDPWDRLLAGYADGPPAPDEWSADGFAPLHLAAFAHNAGAARSLLAHGADPSLAEPDGGTPLAVAEANGFTKVASVLRDAGW